MEILLSWWILQVLQVLQVLQIVLVIFTNKQSKDTYQCLSVNKRRLKDFVPDFFFVGQTKRLVQSFQTKRRRSRLAEAGARMEKRTMIVSDCCSSPCGCGGPLSRSNRSTVGAAWSTCRGHLLIPPPLLSSLPCISRLLLI